MQTFLAVQYSARAGRRARSGSPGYNLLNARLAYEVMDGRAEVAPWAKNLTDEAYVDFAFNLLPAGTLTRYYQLPRTFGAEISSRL